jgi:hypothetical protein
MSDLSRREAMKRAAAGGVVASTSTLLASSVRAEEGEDPAPEANQDATAPTKQLPAATSNHIPISIFIRGKQEIQLTGRKPIADGPSWRATAADPSVVQVTVEPVEIRPFPVEYWELTVTGLKIGSTEVHVQETQATHPIRVLYHFVLDVTVLGLLA